ncbi:hypothetical protein RUND412_010136 [Rhizina undulata]
MKPKFLQRKRKAVSLGGAGLHANESGAETSSPHVQPKKLRPMASTSTSTLVGETTRNLRSRTPELMRSDVDTPFTFQQEKWLFFYVTGFYPRGPATVDWNTVSADYEERFNVRCTARSLEQKWEEMMDRGVTIQFYFPAAEQPVFPAPLTPHPIFTNSEVHSSVGHYPLAPLSVFSDKSPEPQDPGIAPPSSNKQAQTKGQPFTEEETSKKSGTSARKNQDTMATSSQLVINPAKSAKALPWTTEQEEWLLLNCSKNFTDRGVTIDWDQAVEDYIAEWEIVRSLNTLQKKWSRINIKLRGQVETSGANPQEEN